MGAYFSKREDLLLEDYPFQLLINLIRRYDTFLEYVTENFEFAAKTYGKKSFTLIVCGLPNYIMTNDVDNVTHILKTNFDNYPKGPDIKTKFQDLLGNGIFNAE
jgi:hypothetical protein